ncbi:MAG: MFS transporter [Acholeplasmatales bacterium]|nr:MAG: MFS transporter [Acholeplasmatales bacterium]
MKTMALNLNRKLYYGWMIVLMSGLAFFFSAPGQTYSISVFINVYQREMGISSTLISTGYSVATTLSGVSLIFMGRFVDRFGARRMMMIVGVLLALTTFYQSFATHVVFIFIGFFFLRYFGQGSLTLIPSSLVPQWFEKRRAFAISLSGIGNLLATMSVPALNLWLISRFGFEVAWRIWGMALMVGFVPLVALFVFNRPEDLGMPMENGDAGEADLAASLARLEAESFTLKEALRTRAFWIAGLISTIASMFTTGITFHFFSIMRLRSVPEETAAVIIGLVAFPAFFVPLIARIILDKVPVHKVFVVTLTWVILSMAWLAWGVSDTASATLFILFYGSAVAIQSVALNVLWPNYFGRQYLGSIRGAATVFMVLGSALGPLPFGIGYDLSGHYTGVILGMMVYTTCILVLSFFIKKPPLPIR